jgi:hypothetical protein
MKGAAPVEYGMIRFGSGEDYVVEDVLMCLARFSPPRPVKGYAVNVSDSLRGGLSFMEGVDGGNGFNGGSLLPLSRVYVSLEEEGGSLLIAADSMEERARWISGRLVSRSGRNFSGVIHHTYPGTDWTLVGVTTPGWMLLFDEDAPEAEQDILDSEVHVAYLPAEERLMTFLSPDRSTGEALSFLAEYLLSCLPFREGEA